MENIRTKIFLEHR